MPLELGTLVRQHQYNTLKTAGNVANPVATETIFCNFLKIILSCDSHITQVLVTWISRDDKYINVAFSKIKSQNKMLTWMSFKYSDWFQSFFSQFYNMNFTGTTTHECITGMRIKSILIVKEHLIIHRLCTRENKTSNLEVELA